MVAAQYLCLNMAIQLEDLITRTTGNIICMQTRICTLHNC